MAPGRRRKFPSSQRRGGATASRLARRGGQFGENKPPRPPRMGKRRVLPLHLLRRMKLLVLLTDAFGGRGGIAKFNRDLLNALCSYPKTIEVTALPRTITEDPGLLPDRLIYLTQASRGKAAYVYHLGQLLARRKTFDAILCGHLHLLPLAALAARRYEAPLTLIVHGIEAWQKPRVLGLQRSLPS